MLRKALIVYGVVAILGAVALLIADAGDILVFYLALNGLLIILLERGPYRPRLPPWAGGPSGSNRRAVRRSPNRPGALVTEALSCEVRIAEQLGRSNSVNSHTTLYRP